MKFMKLKQHHIKMLFSVFEERGYELQEFNNVGLLNMADVGKDIFNDITLWFTETEGEAYQSTLNPAKQSFLKGGLAGIGAPVLTRKQHRNMDCIDLHGKRKIESFCNRPNTRVSDGKYAGCFLQEVQRDTNRDFCLENEIIQTGYFGMNIHSASTLKEVFHIGYYGEGCWVTRNHKNHLRHIAAAKNTDMYLKNPEVTLFHRTGFDHTELISLYKDFYGGV